MHEQGRRMVRQLLVHYGHPSADGQEGVPAAQEERQLTKKSSVLVGAAMPLSAGRTGKSLTKLPV